MPQTVTKKLTVATTLKTEGNAFFSSGEYKKAIHKYNSVFLYVNGLHGSNSPMKGFFDVMGMDQMMDKKTKTEEAGVGLTEEQESDVVKLKVSTSSNLAACHLKLGNFDKAKSHCEKVLALDPTNSKATFRLASSSIGLNRLDSASEILKKLIAESPNDKAIRAAIEELNVKRGEDKNRQKELRLKEKERFSGKL